jgi:hypothetical protein
VTKLELSEGDPVISELFLTTYGLQVDREELSSAAARVAAEKLRF